MAIVLISAVIAVFVIIIFLSFDLPSKYHAVNWDMAWAGFDSVLLVTLILTLWALFRHKQLAVITSSMAGTILIVDAWLDAVTARAGKDFDTSLSLAIFLELPFAFVLFYFSQLLLKQISKVSPK